MKIAGNERINRPENHSGNGVKVVFSLEGAQSERFGCLFPLETGTLAVAPDATSAGKFAPVSPGFSTKERHLIRIADADYRNSAQPADRL